MSFENVRAFYERLASDEAFRTQMQQVENKEECSQIVQEAGFDFTQVEFEEYTTQLLEANPGEGEIRDLNDEELEAVFGGASFFIDRINLQPMYGMVFRRPHIKWPPIKWPPIQAQPLYGVVVNDQF